MQDLSIIRRLFYRYLGFAYAFTFRTSHTFFLGATVRGWIKFSGLLLLLAAIILRWGVWGIGGTAVLLFWLHFSYWRAQKAGYSKFVPDETSPLPGGEAAPLSPYRRVSLRATGVYQVTEFSQAVLLRPAEYWQVPLGQHIVMVEHRKQKYLYQFFYARTLRQVRKGWLIFGPRPLDTLAVTFVNAWTEENDKPEILTVYLSFADAAEQTAVWQMLARDAAVG